MTESILNMAATSKSAIKVVFGAMTIGKPGIEMTRVTNLEDAGALLDTFTKYGHNEVDTARVYGQGSCEEYLGDLDWQKRGLIMDTKLYPTAVNQVAQGELYSHRPEDLRAGLQHSLKALKTDKLEIWYLHGPDRKTPYEDTLREVNNLYNEGYFKRWGISNFQSWEVALLCDICDRNGWIRPSVYQGLYNVWHRAVEAELILCLRHYGMSLYCFNPLAGGFLTSKFRRNQTEFEPGSRFDPNRNQGKLHHGRYWDDLFFDALDILRPVAKKHDLTESDCALRWLEHHSKLKNELGDAIIVGASNAKHLQDNLEALDQGPLPAEVLQALDDGWAKIRGKELKFWH